MLTSLFRIFFKSPVVILRQICTFLLCMGYISKCKKKKKIAKIYRAPIISDNLHNIYLLPYISRVSIVIAILQMSKLKLDMFTDPPGTECSLLPSF